jgi:hypothetical protein
LREKKHPLQRSANQVHPTDGMRVLVPRPQRLVCGCNAIGVAKGDQHEKG